MENNMNNQNGNNRPQNNNKVSNKNTGLDLKSAGIGFGTGIALAALWGFVVKPLTAKRKAKKAAKAAEQETAPAPEPEAATK